MSTNPNSQNPEKVKSNRVNIVTSPKHEKKDSSIDWGHKQEQGNSSEEEDNEIIPSKGKNLQPIVHPHNDMIELNKEPEKSKLEREREQKRKEMGGNREGAKTTENEEIKPLAETEVMNGEDGGEGRPKIRNDGNPKRFLIKKKRNRVQSGFKNPKKWNERFYLTDGTFQSSDPISKLYERTGSNKAPSGRKKKDYYHNVEKEIRASQNFMKTAQLKPSNLMNMKASGKNRNTFKELKWNDRFSITNSKNNLRVYRDYKEFFDKPIDYDVRGYNYTMRPGPMMVYEDSKGRPDIVRPKFDQKKKKQLAKRISREQARTTREKDKNSVVIKNLKIQKANDYGYSNNEVFSNFLRKSEGRVRSEGKKNRPKTSTRGRKWNQRFAIPISTYNEAVFRKFRLSFEQI